MMSNSFGEQLRALVEKKKKTATLAKIYDFWVRNNVDFDLGKYILESNTKDISYVSIRFSGLSPLEDISNIFELNKYRPTDIDSASSFSAAVASREIKRVSTLHSSALCPALLFHAISEKNPLYIMLSSNNENVKIGRFTKAQFEKQYPIFKTHRGTANMDIVLSGKIEGTDIDVELNIESKFTEYAGETPQKSVFSEAYFDLAKYDMRSKTEKIVVLIRENSEVLADGRRAMESCSCQLYKHLLGLYNKYGDNPLSKEVYFTTLAFKWFEDEDEQCTQHFATINKTLDYLRQLEIRNIRLLNAKFYAEDIFNSTLNPNFILSPKIKSLYNLYTE